MTGGSGDKNKPPEIEVSPEAPIEVAYIASLVNFLNEYGMDYLAEEALTSNERRLDAEKIANNRLLYSSQVVSVIDELNRELQTRHMEMGDYILGDTTAGMGSVAAAMSGVRDKRGKLRE